jgi:acyl carrier protein
MLNRTVQSTRDRVADIVLQLLERRAVKKPDQLGDDLRAIGLSSLDMVNLMLAVEVEFDLKIPEAEMTPQNFRSISSIDALVTALRQNGMAESA